MKQHQYHWVSFLKIIKQTIKTELNNSWQILFTFQIIFLEHESSQALKSNPLLTTIFANHPSFW